jgi:hypothetical protein
MAPFLALCCYNGLEQRSLPLLMTLAAAGARLSYNLKEREICSADPNNAMQPKQPS